METTQETVAIGDMDIIKVSSKNRLRVVDLERWLTFWVSVSNGPENLANEDILLNLSKS